MWVFCCLSVDVSPFPKDKNSQALGGVSFFLLRADSNPRAGFPIPIRYVIVILFDLKCPFVFKHPHIPYL